MKLRGFVFVAMGLLALAATAVQTRGCGIPSESPSEKSSPDAARERLAALWVGLHGVDPRGEPVEMAFFLNVPEETVAFFAERIPTARKPKPGEVESLIEELGSVDFPRRAKASAALETWHRMARPAVQSALYRKMPLEKQRRLEQLVHKMDDIGRCPEILRQKNAVWILYKLNTVAARGLLRQWAAGAPEAYLTREAKDRLASLEKPAR